MVRVIAWAGLILCLGAGLWLAAGADATHARVCRSDAGRLSGAEVEKSFEEATGLLKAGKTVEALLLLQKRSAAKDALSGAALFLMGEAAFAEGAQGKGIERYIEAVRADPSLADRLAPWDASKKMAARIASLKNGPVSLSPEELSRMNYLERRLSGGCQ